jgi:type III restriction enzyme
LKDFKLANQDSNISIENVENEIWQLNVDETENGNDSTLVVSRLKQKDIQDLIQQVAQMTDTSQINQIESSILIVLQKSALSC